MVRQAWKKTALRLHPDKNQGDPTAEERFKRAKEAYEVTQPPRLRHANGNPLLHPISPFPRLGAQVMAIGSKGRSNPHERAAQVLSDPEKRAFYDRHGEEGLKMKEAYDNMDASIFLQAFAHSSCAVSLAMMITMMTMMTMMMTMMMMIRVADP